MASAGVERRVRANTYSQGDSSSYSFQLRSSTKKEGGLQSEGNTILEDYEVDVAILLSQMNKHNIELSAEEHMSGRVAQDAEATMRQPSAEQLLSLSGRSPDLTDEEYTLIFSSAPPRSADKGSGSAHKAFKASTHASPPLITPITPNPTPLSESTAPVLTGVCAQIGAGATRSETCSRRSPPKT